MKSHLLYLGVAVLLFWYGLTYAQRIPPARKQNVQIAGVTIQAESSPLQRLEAFCELAGHCELAESERVSPLIQTVRVGGVRDGVLELRVEHERTAKGSMKYVEHRLETYLIPLRYIAPEETTVSRERPPSATAVWCDHVEIVTIRNRGVGVIHSSTTDLLTSQTSTGSPSSTLNLYFTNLDASHGARQAIIDLAEESLREPASPQPIGRIGQD